MTTDRSLNDIMEIDHVIEVLPNGSIIDREDLYAPSLFDDELDDSKWEFFSAGYTRQDGYNGPIMHDSELVGGRLESDIRETPGVYAVIPAYYSPEDDDEDGETIGEGWAVVTLTNPEGD